MDKINRVLWTRNKGRIVTGVIVSLILWGLFGVSVFMDKYDPVCHSVSILLIFVTMIALFWGFKMNRIVSILFIVIIPAVCFYALEGYSHVAFADITAGIQFLNLCFMYFLFLVLLFAFGRSSIALAVLSLVLMMIGLINYYVVAFRGTPIVPWDLMSVSTALSVTVNYEFTVNGRVVMIILIFVLAAVIGTRTDFSMKWSVKRGIALTAAIALIFGYASLLQTSYIAKAFALDDILFTPNVMCRNNGFTVTFLNNLQYMQTKKPTGYSSQKVDEIIAKNENSANASETSKKYPNIVVVMNESYSDMADIADIKTNIDYMPYTHAALNGELDNCVSGRMLASVLGGNTANSEFEFLTGNTMAFLPPGSIAYQQYIKRETPNMTEFLADELGYKTIAMHPYGASGWNRNIVYPFFGFDESYFSGDMRNRSCYLNKDVAYLRDYISDQALMNMIIGRYERHEDEEPLFTFAVTMQNHGGYFEPFSNFREDVSLIGVKEDYRKEYMDRYLSLMKRSDEAFENMIHFFEEYDEPTIVLTFGDHQPGDYVVQGIYDTKKEYTLQEQQKRYLVPFVMWANFDIEDEHIDLISANYLSSLLADKAGIPMTGYQSFLSELYKTLPVITANVMMDRDGEMYAVNDWKNTPYAEQMSEYAILQYNHLFDKKGRNDAFFGGDSRK